MPVVIALAAAAAATAIRWHLLDVPLERDEGEYAYAGRLLLEGVPPFRSVEQCSCEKDGCGRNQAKEADQRGRVVHA
ncbi:MAG: hypothetical protein WCH13_09845, partial [Deltaproteobacteria bacterium]